MYDFGRLVSVDGRKQPKAAADGGPAVRGTVVRFKYARHGAANGVVLDSGDFIHLKPEGMARAGLRIGDAVQAEGDVRPLATGSGQVIEAAKVTRRRAQASAK